MAEYNKMVSLVLLVLAGLAVAIWGGLFLWFHRSDRMQVQQYVSRGTLTAAEADKLTNTMWYWVLGVTQILVGLALIAWGLFQYFAKVEDVVVKVREGASGLIGRLGDRTAGGARYGMSHRSGMKA